MRSIWLVQLVKTQATMVFVLPSRRLVVQLQHRRSNTGFDLPQVYKRVATGKNTSNCCFEHCDCVCWRRDLIRFLRHYRTLLWIVTSMITNAILLTVWFHASTQTLLVATHFADITRFWCDITASIARTLIFQTVSLLYATSEETLNRPN